MAFNWRNWCGVVWCGVVWCGVVWCGVAWCGVVWCTCPSILIRAADKRMTTDNHTSSAGQKKKACTLSGAQTPYRRRVRTIATAESRKHAGSTQHGPAHHMNSMWTNKGTGLTRQERESTALFGAVATLRSGNFSSRERVPEPRRYSTRGRRTRESLTQNVSRTYHIGSHSVIQHW